MKITTDMIQKAVDNANACLYSIYPKYIEPNFINIKFTNAKSYWAMIGQSTGKAIGNYHNFNMKIGKLFEMIPDPEVCILRLEECMIHELIHTIPSYMNHGYYFKSIANKINRKYPKYRIETQTEASRYGLPEFEAKNNYEIKCNHCGNISYRNRKLKYDISQYTCAKCGSDKLEIKKI